MVSDLIRESIKQSIGLLIVFHTTKGFHYEGKVLGCDDQFLKYNDRVQGVKIISLDEIREVQLK